MGNEVIARVRVSVMRRLTGVAMLATVGGSTIYVAMTSPPPPVWQMLLIIGGLLSLWMSVRMYRATEFDLELTETELRDSGGQRIALVADIVSLDRGLLAFKPSHGFLIKTRTPGTRVWQPGMWWRYGRRVGVGGVVPAAQTKAMANRITAMLALRDQEFDHTS
jgi:hypothetical protein